MHETGCLHVDFLPPLLWLVDEKLCEDFLRHPHPRTIGILPAKRM
jgi:hypothetical protein